MSETEKSSPKSNQSLRDTLISIAAAVVKGILESPAEREDAASGSFWQAVKLVHADDLQKWDSFKEYSEHNSITYTEYREGVKRIKALKKQVNKFTPYPPAPFPRWGKGEQAAPEEQAAARQRREWGDDRPRMGHEYTKGRSLEDLYQAGVRRPSPPQSKPTATN